MVAHLLPKISSWYGLPLPKLIMISQLNKFLIHTIEVFVFFFRCRENSKEDVSVLLMSLCFHEIISIPCWNEIRNSNKIKITLKYFVRSITTSKQIIEEKDSKSIIAIFEFTSNLRDSLKEWLMVFGDKTNLLK